MTPFAAIRARAASRKGGEAALAALMPKIQPLSALTAMADSRFLAEMSKRIFCSGFVWSVIEKKWPGFEEAFLGFEPMALLHRPPDYWDALTADKRIVRNGQKIMSVARNAQFIADIAAVHGSFGRFLADWPVDDEAGLLDLLAKRGNRLGGNTGQMFLRFVGRDGWVLSRDVVLCLRDAGLDIAEQPGSKRDMARIQDCFNGWARESGLPYTHLSRICAMSIGENYSAEQIAERMGD